MQNYDLYSRKAVRDFPREFNRTDPEYFTSFNSFTPHEEHKGIKKASWTLSLIFALCIISFTAGLIIGIKFSSGSDKKLVDPKTKETMTGIGSKVATLIGNNKASNQNKLFDRAVFPYIIKVGDYFNKQQSQEIANELSGYGHRVIVSNDGGKYKLYTGPYQSLEIAKKSLDIINSYPLKEIAKIIKI